MKKTCIKIAGVLMASVMLNSIPTSVSAVENISKQTVVAKKTATVYVSSQKQLNKALKNSSVKTVIIKTNKTVNFYVHGNHKNVKLQVKAPKAYVSNYAKFKEISFDANKWTERSKGNSITVLSKKTEVTVAKGAEIKKISFPVDNANISVKSKGSVSSLLVKGSVSLRLTGTSKKSTFVNVLSKGADITAAFPVEVKAMKDIKVTLNKGAEKSYIKAAKDDVTVVVYNNTDKSLKVSNVAGNNFEIAANTAKKLNGKNSELADIKTESKDDVKDDKTEKNKKDKENKKPEEEKNYNYGHIQTLSQAEIQALVDKTVINIDTNGKKMDFTEDDESVELDVKFTPANAPKRDLEWTVEKGNVSVKQNGSKVIIKAIDNGEYVVRATLKAKPSTYKEVSGMATGQKIGLANADGKPYVAGDKKISGLNSGLAYVLKDVTENTFLAISAEGKVAGKFATQEEAVRSAEILAGTVITDISNASKYEVIELNQKEVIKAKYSFYVKHTADNVDLNNYEILKKLGEELSQEFQFLISIAEESKKAELNKQKEEVERVKNLLKDKIEDCEKRFNEFKADLTKLKKNSNGDYTLTFTNTDKEAWKQKYSAHLEFVNKIVAVRDVLNEINRSKFVDELEHLDNFKKDLEAVNIISEMSEFTLEVNGDIKHNFDISKIDKIVLLKSGNPDEPTINSEKADTKEIKDVSSLPNCLHTMRNKGVGKYKAMLEFKGFSLNTTTAKAVSSNSQEIKKIENTLGLLRVESNNFKKIADSDSASEYMVSSNGSKVRFNRRTGDITWDDVANATSYDIVADIAILSTETNLGGYYLKSTEDASGNIENEYEVQQLKNIDNKAFDYLADQRGGRSFVKTGITDKTINLKEFLPIQGTTFNLSDPPRDGDGCIIRVYIIPRNLNSSYVSMKDYFDAGGFKKDNRPVNNVHFDNILWKDLKQYYPGWSEN